jgi:hypothetical protein
MLAFNHQGLNLINQERKIGGGKTQTRGRNPVMLDVRWDMFMMGMGTGERRIVGMGLRVIPVQFLATVPDLIAVALNSQWAGTPGQALLDDQAMPSREHKLACQLSK